MRKPGLPKLTRQNMEGAPEERWVDSVKTTANESARQIEQLRSADHGVKLLENADVELVEVEVQVPDPWIKVSTTAGAPTFQNSWTNYGGGYTVAAFMKHPDGSVEIKGTVKDGAIGTLIFTLPVGYTPRENFNIAVSSASAHGDLYIGSNGTLTAGTGVNTDFGLACRFLSSDATPIPLSCWPKLIRTKFKKVSAVLLAEVVDGETTKPLPAGLAHHPVWEMTTQKGEPNVKLLNIAGLPYNRKSRIKLLIVGG